MITRRALTGVMTLAAAALSGAPAAAQAPTAAGRRRAEVEALRRFAEATHPRGREAAADTDWRARWDTLAAEADTLSDGRYFVRTRRALAWFKDGHTTVLPFEFVGGAPAALASGPFGLHLPLRVRVFHDGAYVIQAKDEAAPLLGARLMRVGDLDADDLVRALAQDWPGNDAWAHRWAGRVFSTPAFLEAYGAVRDPVASFDVRGAKGNRRINARLRPRAGAGDGLADVARRQSACEDWARAANAGNYAKLLPEQHAIYLSIDEMDDVEGKSFEQFTREAFVAMDDAAASRLIIDLRRNGGGNNFLPEALRKRILRSRFNRPGGLYCLISPLTFSAAQNLVTRIERDSFAIFVGEPTGGAPNHYGDAQILAGDATGITSMVSTLPWFDSYPQDQRTWIMPDIFTPSLYSDWRDGRDAALDAALAHTPASAVDEIDRHMIFFYRRESQAAEWRPFWRTA